MAGSGRRYNENTFDFDRTGSHNLVVGSGHGWTSFGGLVAGEVNRILGPYATVSGGHLNTVSGEGTSVSGGVNHEAPGVFDWVAGGLFQDF